jgi:hypothetical protein
MPCVSDRRIFPDDTFDFIPERALAPSPRDLGLYVVDPASIRSHLISTAFGGLVHCALTF